MSDKGGILGLSLLSAILFSGCTRGVANTNQLRAASALFGDFETVFYSKAEFASGSGAYKQLSPQDANELRLPFVYLTWGLDYVRQHASADILDGSEAVLIGAKDFRPPVGLGSVDSQFCYVVVFGRRGAPDLHKYFSGAPVGSGSGNPVWQWSAPPQEGHPKPYTFYVTRVPHSYVLVSNNLEELKTLAIRLSSSEKNKPTLTDVRDWKLISQHNYWGYRRYRHSGVVNKEAAGMSDVTPSAEALLFFADSKQKTGVLRLLASDDSSADKLNAAIANVKAALPPLKRHDLGVWQATIPLAGDEETSERMFVVMGLFGFGIYL